jgi:hypothetical protein
MIISFLHDETIHFFNIHFSAIKNNKQILCRISFETIQDCFKSNSYDELDTFRKNLFLIERKAENLIVNNEFESDGTIFIQKFHFC